MAGSVGRNAARAIDALRRGWPVRLVADDGAIRLMAIEGADAVTLADVEALLDATAYEAITS